MAADETTTELAMPEVPAVPEKLPQKVEITDAGPCKKHVKVVIDGAVVRTRFDEKYSSLMVERPAMIPGFRPGKAPRKIVEKKFSKDVAVDVRTEVLMASLEQLAEEDKLSPLAPPQLDPNSVVMPEDGSDMVYEFDIEVRPEFDLPEYKNLKIRRPIHTPTDADVVKETRRLLEPYSTLVAKPEVGGKPAVLELGDVMVADMTLQKGDVVLNKVPDLTLKIEKRLALEDGVAETFGEKVSGAKAGETRIVDIVLSDDLANETLKGQTVQAHFHILEVKVTRLPELTPAVLEPFNVRTPEQFDILVRTRLERLQEYHQRQTARQQVLQLLAGQANWELPQDLLKRQAQKTLARRVMEMRSAGMSEEQIVGRQRVLAQNVLASTAAALKEHFVLQKIAEVEKLEIEEADLDAEIDSIADRTGDTPRKVRARLQREDLMEVLATELLERKALDLILSSAAYEDYEMNPLAEDDGSASTIEAGQALSANS